MKARLLVLFLSFLCSAPALQAQLYAGGSFALNDPFGDLSLHIAPDVGYNLNDEWALGGILTYTKKPWVSYSEIDVFSLMPYARFTFFREEAVSLFVEGLVDIVYTDKYYQYGALQPGELRYGAGFIPGIAYRASAHFTFFSKCGFLGQNVTILSRQNGIGLSSENTSIGFYYHF
jgi:hypothetical protein